MNLHGVVAGAIGAVNPFTTVTVSLSTGYRTLPDGTREPTYRNVPVKAQIQAMTFKDLTQVASLNLNGTRRAIYFYGEVDAVVRAFNKGGDVVTDAQGNNWLVAQVLEQWPDWVKVAVTLQNAKDCS